MDSIFIRRTVGDRGNFIVEALFGCTLAIVALNVFHDAWLLAAVSVFATINHFIYSRVDFVFNVELYRADGGLSVRFAGLSWRLNEHSFLRTENIKLFSKSYANTPEYSLILHRRSKSFWSRLFKNRIKLYRGNADILQEKMLEIHSKTGIRHFDFYDPFPL